MSAPTPMPVISAGGNKLGIVQNGAVEQGADARQHERVDQQVTPPEPIRQKD